MSADAVLDDAFTTLLAKALRRQDEQANVAAVRPATAIFQWSGGGLPIVPTACDPILVEVPFPCSISWAHLFAGDAAGKPVAVTAALEVQLTQLATFGRSVPLNGVGLTPRLISAATADMDLTGWQMNLVTGDVIIARLTAMLGLATWIALTLQFRPTDVGLGVSTVVDGTGAALTDASGATMVFRG